MEAAVKTSIESVDRSLGMAVGMMVVTGNIITEMEALKMLTSVDAIPLGIGGVGGGEGSKTFVLDGPAENVQAAYDFACSNKGEPTLLTAVQRCDFF